MGDFSDEDMLGAVGCEGTLRDAIIIDLDSDMDVTACDKIVVVFSIPHRVLLITSD